RLTVFSGDPAVPSSRVLPDERLSPGEFKQFNQILISNGLSLNNGYVRVERVGGKAPYYAYAVINDQINSDGSFVPPVPEAGTGLTLPVIVETDSFSSELVIANWSELQKTVQFGYVADAISTFGSEALFALTLNPGEQRIIPDFVQYLRDQGT